MKKIFHVFVSLMFVCLFWFQTASACSIYIPPLRKDFRAAKSVFLGKVLKIENDYIPTENEKQGIPSYWKTSAGVFSKVTFEIKNKWKGNLSERQDFVAVANWSCGCPGSSWDRFAVGEEFVVFASGKKFVTVCDSWRQKIDGKDRVIKKLDDFGFRLWSRIYPF